MGSWPPTDFIIRAERGTRDRKGGVRGGESDMGNVRRVGGVGDGVGGIRGFGRWGKRAVSCPSSGGVKLDEAAPCTGRPNGDKG